MATSAAIPSRNDDELAEVRRGVYLLLIVVALSSAIARIWTVEASTGESPMLSANDRSRWANVHALVDYGTFAIDDVIAQRHPKTGRYWWDSIDKVRHRGPDGQQHYYSSKPPLLATVVAGVYWCVRQLSGLTIAERPFYVMRIILIVVNVLPLTIYLVVLARLVERYGRRHWGRLLVMTAGVAGTFVTTYVVTLNNHLPAAVSILLATYCGLAIWRDGKCGWLAYAGCGLFSAIAVTCELPCLAFATVALLAAFIRSPLRTVLAMGPAAAVVAAAFFGTNYLAHQSWRPPYAHRGTGALVRELDGTDWDQLTAGRLASDDRQALEPWLASDLEVLPGRRDDQAVLWSPQNQSRLAVRCEGEAVRVYVWDDWYDYDGSHWRMERTGVDRGEPSRVTYAYHVLFGHHGLISLTPLWAFSLLGMLAWIRLRDDELSALAVLTAALTVICLAFYIARPTIDRNYGGVNCGFRWMIWFTPLWLLTLLPVADSMAHTRLWRWVGLLALAVGILSATYPGLNPWTHPWIYAYMQYLGLIEPS